MEKRITVMTAETGVMKDVAILPGTTAGEILKQLGLPDGYLLSTGKGQKAFAPEETRKVAKKSRKS